MAGARAPRPTGDELAPASPSHDAPTTPCPAPPPSLDRPCGEGKRTVLPLMTSPSPPPLLASPLRPRCCCSGGGCDDGRETPPSCAPSPAGADSLLPKTTRRSMPDEGEAKDPSVMERGRSIEPPAPPAPKPPTGSVKGGWSGEKRDKLANARAPSPLPCRSDARSEPDTTPPPAPPPAPPAWP